MKPNIKTFTNLVNSGQGASYNMRDGILNPQEGYMVSLFGREMVTRRQEDNTLTIRHYILKYGAELDAEGTFIGAWGSGEALYLDVSIQVFTLAEALKLGRANNQICIWDCRNNTEIYL